MHVGQSTCYFIFHSCSLAIEDVCSLISILCVPVEHFNTFDRSNFIACLQPFPRAHVAFNSSRKNLVRLLR